MCGRFVSASPPERIAAYFGADVDVESLGDNFNVAPTNDIYAVVASADADSPPQLPRLPMGFAAGLGQRPQGRPEDDQRSRRDTG